MADKKEDPLKQARALEKAVLRHNDIRSMVDLGCLLLAHKQFISQRARGVQMLERAVKQAQYPKAMFFLADHLLDSDNGKDHARAFSLLQRALKLEENCSILDVLGYCYHKGRGVAKDPKLAVQMCERALRLDQDPQIMANLAFTLLHAPDMKSHSKRAVALYEKAISLSSDGEMMNNLGLVYHSGESNVRTCLKRASKWYERAIRTSQNPKAMYNLATLLLENEPNAEDALRAVRLLEESLERIPREKTIVTLAEAYLEHQIDVERAIQLYETAAIQFKSREACSFLFSSWVEGMSAVHLDHERIFQFCLAEFKANQSHFSLLCAGEMEWTGTKQSKMNRKNAVEFLDLNHWTRHDCFSLMLRHDLSVYPGGKKAARRILKKFDDKIDRNNLTDSEAIVVSEIDCEEDKLLALDNFRAQRSRKNSFNEVAWVCPHLRVSRCNLPFHGHPHCITDTMRRFTRWTNIASLNLASLLLEIEGKQQEAVKVLEELLDSDLRLLGMMNLAHILMNNVSGVAQNRARGLQLLEDAVRETNDASARAMLANALSQRADSDEGDVERGWNLWRGVVDELEEKELHNVRRLISSSSAEKWRALELDSSTGRLQEAK